MKHCMNMSRITTLRTTAALLQGTTAPACPRPMQRPVVALSRKPTAMQQFEDMKVVPRTNSLQEPHKQDLVSKLKHAPKISRWKMIFVPKTHPNKPRKNIHVPKTYYLRG
jgi:hypothetical protein